MCYNSKKREIFFNSVRSGDIDEVRRLIEEGVDINARDNYGATALMSASFQGHIIIAQLLIEAGIDVNAQSNDGSTPKDVF